MSFSITSSSRQRARSFGATTVELLILVALAVGAVLAGARTLGSGTKSKSSFMGACVMGTCSDSGSGSSGGESLAKYAVPQAPPDEGGLWKNTKDFGYGIGAEAVDTVKGAYGAIRHPIDTAKNLAFVAKHPLVTWGALKDEWSQRSTAENVGRGLLEVATLVGPAAAAKLAKAAEVAAEASKAAKAAEEAAAAAKAAQAAKAIPANAQKVVDVAKAKNGAVQAGFKGGSKFANDGRDASATLPKTTADGTPINYKEYDTTPKVQGVDRTAERVVIGSDGKAYYTSDHYKSFTPIP